MPATTTAAEKAAVSGAAAPVPASESRTIHGGKVTASDLLSDVGAIAAFAALGSVLLLAGYALVDVLTPGKLHELIWEQRNVNAAILLSANVIAVAMIVVVSIRSSYDGLGEGLISTAAYSVLGLIFMAISFVAVDALTPGKLGHLLVERERHPAVWVSASANLATAAMICAAIN
ncbi:DUF350 domain-containing protein [Yimella sp. cx-573]|nr:DUF350 domain-containing protein [Yimella sp. cx-573]